MKVYILYALCDYTHAIHISTEKHLCEQKAAECAELGVRYPMRIEEYDFTKAKQFELNSD
jgi:hypothetical protein